MDPKKRQLPELCGELERLRAEGKRIVLCHGVFDLLHVGHIRHFQQARQLGDLLVVTVTPDRYVNKGANRPAFPQELRAEVIASLDCVDFVAVNLWSSAVETIERLRPHVFAKGSEFKHREDTLGHVAKEEQAVRQVGGEIAFTDDITFSSSGVINQFLSPFSQEVIDYLVDFSKRYTADDVLRPLCEARNKSVLLIGETILDEYRYCDAIGKSGKEPVLVTQIHSVDEFVGGILACANHVASFCDHVSVLSFIGEHGEKESFIRQHLKPNIEATLLRKPESPTLTKMRFVERYSSQKLFEVYEMNDQPLDAQTDARLCSMLKSTLPKYDIVIVADYGHGMLSPNAISVICAHANFLAVNTQSNAGNHGFNMISKYPRADYVCLAQREFALETRNQQMTPEEMVLHVSRNLQASRLMLTQGRSGSLSYSKEEGFRQVPAFNTDVVDRVGAGDAVLSTTALAVASGAAAEAVGFLGNVVGADSVKIMGNKQSIERLPLFRHVECLMKAHNPSRESDEHESQDRRKLRIAA